MKIDIKKAEKTGSIIIVIKPEEDFFMVTGEIRNLKDMLPAMPGSFKTDTVKKYLGYKKDDCGVHMHVDNSVISSVIRLAGDAAMSAVMNFTSFMMALKLADSQLGSIKNKMKAAFDSEET